MSPGSGRLSGRTTFDVAEAIEDSCGTFAIRRAVDKVYANFALESTYKQIYTFTPTGSVSNVRFAYVEPETGIVTSLTPDADYSGTISSPSTCTATMLYDKTLNTKAAKKTRSEAFKVDIYAIYESNGQDCAEKLTAWIQDCAFSGAYTTTGAWLVFMPYNLGANPNYATPETQMAYPPNPSGTASTDMTVYGGLFQWGRSKDGHEDRNKASKNGTSNSPTPGNTFLHGSSNWYTGSSPAPDVLWTASKAANDPCPPGYKVPTMTQWRSIFNGGTGNPTYATINTANTHNSWSLYSGGGTKGAYSGSTLFLPAAGYRYYSDGSRRTAGSTGYYWSSTQYSPYAYYLYFTGDDVGLGYYTNRAHGSSVRCVAE
jgi:uncharacterized protein (TIGR02145 family)